MSNDPDICWQAYLKDTNSVLQLLNDGADIESLDNDKRTPLLNAVSGKDANIDLIKSLVKKGANLNAQDNKGFSALHFCAQDGNLEILEYLLRMEAQVDLRDDWGNTPLMRALNSCYAAMAKEEPNPGSIIKALLGAGANPESINNYEVKILDSAEDCDRDLLQFFK